MAPKVALRRPAASGRARAAALNTRGDRRGRNPGGIKRPAQAPVGGQHPPALRQGDWVIGTEALYYGHREVQEEKNEEGRRMISVRLTGTTIDLLVQWASLENPISRWHLCPPDCRQELEGEGLVHVLECHQVTLAELEAVGWATNLRAVLPQPDPNDENAALRERLKKIEAEHARGEGALREESPLKKDHIKKPGKSRDRSRDQKKKKDRKKKKRSPSASPEREKKKDKRPRSPGASPASARGRGDRKARDKPSKHRSSSSSSSTEGGRVSQRRMFRGTALDLSSRVRKKVQRRARRFMKKKRSSSSQADSSEESRGLGLKEDFTPLFGDELKIRGVSERYPGLLAGEALRGINRMVSSDMGDTISSGRQWTPQMVRYFRQVLSRRISGAMARELLTHCSVIDALLEGNIPLALDIGLQRIKGLELQANGTSFQVSQRLEVIPSEVSILPSRQELAIIQRERQQEAKAFGGGAYPSAGAQGKGKAGVRDDRQSYKGKEARGKGKNKNEGKKGEDQKKGSSNPAV
eukprot:s637_g16.t1